MGVHYVCVYCRNSFNHTVIQRENHLLTSHLSQITRQTGFQVKSRFPRSSSILLQKEYSRVTRRFSSENQLNLLATVINFFSILHDQVKNEIKLLSCWSQGDDGHVEKLWFSLPNFSWHAGEAGLNNFLLRSFRDYFLPDLEDSHPRNASAMSFLGVEIVDPKHVISPGGSGYSCFKYCMIASSYLRSQQRKNMSPALHRKLENLHLIENSKIVRKCKQSVCLDGINSPATLLDFDKFVSNNPHIGLTVFESRDERHLNTIYVSENFSEQIWKVRLFSFKSQKNKISHLCLIPNFSTFINSLSSLNGQKVARQLLCQFCELKQTPKLQILQEHEIVCERNPHRVPPVSQLNFPPSEVPIRVMNSGVKSAPLLTGFCDFETYCEQIDDPTECEKCQKLLLDCHCSFVINKGVFRSLSYHLLILDGNSNETVFEKYCIKESVSSQDAGENLVYTLWNLKYIIFNILSQNYKYDLSKFNLKKK